MDSTASSDEGEIRDSSVEKANTSLSQIDGISVDRQGRNRSSSTSISSEQDYRSRRKRSSERSRSPRSYRQPRGSKRTRDEDYVDRSRGDSRRFMVHYEDTSIEYQRRTRPQYAGAGASAGLRYDDYDEGYAEKRARTRSRSPYRANRVEDRYAPCGRSQKDENKSNGYGRNHRSYGKGEIRSREMKDQSVRKREPSPLHVDKPRHEAKNMQGQSQYHSNLSQKSSALNNETLSIQPSEEEPLDEAALIEQRRKRREAIKAKYKGSATPLLVQALQLGDKAATSTPSQPSDKTDPALSTIIPTFLPPLTPIESHIPGSPSAFVISNDMDLVNAKGHSNAQDENDGPSAADYDPTMDMREDRQRDDQRHNEDLSLKSDEDLKPTDEKDETVTSKEATAPERLKKPKDDFDMFAEEEEEDDDDDMFAEELALKPETRASDDVEIDVPKIKAKELDIGMLDNWDDVEGYYKIILGELLNGRYHVQANLGKGMFSGVVRAMDMTTKKLVAIKLIRNNETMKRAGMKEIEIIQKINDADPEDRKHLIRLERHFEHKGHLCMVFENLSINLREVLKKFGRDVGINLRAVRTYAQQMFLGLSLMRKCNILHADLKPDNILVNENRNFLKICDLGSASDASENEITPYLVSRFYRAPEIILGMQYDFAIDIWSIGCTLYELYTGKILFTGRTNNQMLRSIMDCRGKFPTKMLKRSQFAHVHFDEMANFRSFEQDKISGKDVIKTLAFSKPSRDLRIRLMSASKGLTESETKELALFTDLLDRCLALNPEKRITPNDALKHPFIMKALR